MCILSTFLCFDFSQVSLVAMTKRYFESIVVLCRYFRSLMEHKRENDTTTSRHSFYKISIKQTEKKITKTANDLSFFSRALTIEKHHEECWKKRFISIKNNTNITNVCACLYRI